MNPTFLPPRINGANTPPGPNLLPVREVLTIHLELLANMQFLKSLENRHGAVDVVVRELQSVEADEDIRETFFKDGIELAFDSLSRIKHRVLFSLNLLPSSHLRAKERPAGWSSLS
jgi:hypothetical protein